MDDSEYYTNYFYKNNVFIYIETNIFHLKFNDKEMNYVSKLNNKFR